MAVLRRTDSHLTQGGPATMMPMPVNRISFLQRIDSFFLIVMFCSAIHVYTDRFADMGIIVDSSPLAEVRIPRRAAARAHFPVINKGAGQFCMSFDTR